MRRLLRGGWPSMARGAAVRPPGAPPSRRGGAGIGGPPSRGLAAASPPAAAPPSGGGPKHPFAKLKAQQAFEVERQQLEAEGTDGITPPPPGVALLPNHVWCGLCSKEVCYVGGNMGWRLHVEGAAHRAAQHRVSMAALKAESAGPTRKAAPRRGSGLSVG